MASHFSLRALLVALCLGATLVRSQALQLGETEAQVIARHGSPGFTDHAKNFAMYYWSGWSARLEFQGGIIRKLTYKKDSYLAPAEITSLLQANGGAAQWTQSSPAGAKSRQWTRKDGASAKVEGAKTTVMIFEGGHPLGVPATAPLNKAAAEPIVRFNATPMPIDKPLPRTLPTLREEPTEESAAQAPDAASMQRLLSVKDKLGSVISAPTPAVALINPAKPGGRPSPFVFVACTLVILLAGLTAAKSYLADAGRNLLERFRSQKPAAPDSESEPTYVAPAPVSPKKPQPASGLETLRWDQFELLVGELYRREGYSVELSAALGSDGGIDLTLRRGSEMVLVQCKHWKTSTVAAREMREFYGAMAACGAPRGIFVTTGSFSRDAREFAEGKDIDLVDRELLEERVAALARPGEDLCAVDTWVAEFAEKARIFDPECPTCRSGMSLRRNRTTSEQFWGCVSYPRCGGTREARLDLIPLGIGNAPQPAYVA